MHFPRSRNSASCASTAPVTVLSATAGRNDSEWPQVAREIIAAEKAKFIVMMIGNNDHQQIREKAQAVKPGAPRANAQRSRLMRSFSSPSPVLSRLV
jgi:hypothetical protein